MGQRSSQLSHPASEILQSLYCHHHPDSKCNTCLWILCLLKSSKTSVSTDDTRKLPDIPIPEMLKRGEDVNTMNTVLNKKTGLCIRGCKYLSQAGTSILTNIFYHQERLHVHVVKCIIFLNVWRMNFVSGASHKNIIEKKPILPKERVVFFFVFFTFKFVI